MVKKEFESYWSSHHSGHFLRLRPNDLELHSRKIEDFGRGEGDNASSLMIGWAEGFNEKFQF